MDAPGKPVLFTTFTRTLADDVRSQIAAITTPAEREKIEVANIDQRHCRYCVAGYRHEPAVRRGQGRELWARIDAQAGRRAVPGSVLSGGIRARHLAAGVRVRGRLSARQPRGRGRQLSRSARRELGPVLKEYRAQLRSANLREPEEAYRDALAILKREGMSLGINSIVVDEGCGPEPSGVGTAAGGRSRGSERPVHRR